MVVDARGTPLGVTLSGANRHDSTLLAATLDAIPPVRSGRRGRPRRRPAKLHADLQAAPRPVPPGDRFAMGYDYGRCRGDCRSRGMKARIARRGIESSQRLGRHRWVVERTHAWLARLRRLSVRYERREDIHLAFTLLGCALVCMNQVRRLC